MRRSHPLGLTNIDLPAPQTYSLLQVALLEKEWKANRAVRESTLVQKLCSSLENILEYTLMAANDENHVQARFSPRIQLGASGREDLDWMEDNSTERTSRTLLIKGVFEALAECLWVYRFRADAEKMADRGSSKVDFVIQLNGEDKALIPHRS
ncbi:hypothetical protein APHAL10511_002531 [Amanita phalloides]|nr:hypothetical protein APHAL10511_002531 [Amanita phalloides]